MEGVAHGFQIGSIDHILGFLLLVVVSDQWGNRFFSTFVDGDLSCSIFGQGAGVVVDVGLTFVLGGDVEYLFSGVMEDSEHGIGVNA